MWLFMPTFNIRFKFGGKPKSVTPPALPPPATSQTQIIEGAQRAGETEGRRQRKRTGRRATRLSRPELAFVPAPIARAGLSTNLAGVSG